MTRRRHALGVLLTFLLVAWLPACSGAAATSGEARRATTPTIPATATPTPALEGAAGAPPPEEAAGAPPTVASPTRLPATADWRLANGDERNTRAIASAIDSRSVGRLAPAWTFDIPGSSIYGSAAGAPLIVDGVVYFQNLTSDLFAFALDDGEELWRAEQHFPVAGPNGPAYADGRLFAPIGRNEFAALDAASGEELWAVELRTDSFQPGALGDTVYATTSTLAHSGGESGRIHALDVATGDERWSFQVVEEGFWGDAKRNSGGGVWYPPAIDAGTGTVYYGTGNPAPYPGTAAFPNGSSRPGANLYTSSLLALDATAGGLRWYDQVVEHDLFDHDFQAPPVLVEAMIDDELRSLVVGGGKAGRVIAFDAASGERLWDTAVGIHKNDDLEAIPPGQTVEVYPGIYGGVETPMAVADGRVFVPVVNAPTWHTATGHGAADGYTALLNASTNTGLTTIGTGELVALDLATGEVAWSHEFDSPVFAGATVVSDLVFTATFDGVIYALRLDDGVVVWSYDTGGGINAWPAVAGDTIVWAVGIGRPPQLIAFRLAADGEQPSP